MVGVNVLVRSKVAKKTVGATIEIVTSDDALASLDDTGNDIETSHTTRNGEAVLAVLELAKMVLKHGSGWVAGAGVVKLGTRKTLEGGGHVDGGRKISRTGPCGWGHLR